MKTRMILVFLIAIGMVFGGCTVTSSDIQKWKTTQKGPEKLAAVLLDDKYAPQLRAEAAWSLASIGEWDKYDKALKVIEPPGRGRVIDALVPVLVKAVEEGNAPPSPPTADQVAAKDALFVVMPMAEGAAKTRAEDVLVEWCVLDFNNRFFAGRYSVEVVLTEIGPRAADGLVATLKPGFLAYDKVTELLAKIGSKEAKEEAGKKLVAVARTREGRVEEALLVALGRMGGQEVRELLLELGANLKIPARVQRGGLMAYLQFKLCDKEDLGKLFAIAEDSKQDYMSRNFAYDAIVCAGDKTRVPRIYKLLHEVGKDKDRFRGVGVDEILKLGGPETIPAIVGEIGAEKDPWESFEDLRDFVMLRFTQDDDGKPLEDEGRKKVLEQIRPLVKSKETLSRAIAVFTLGLIGESSDAGMLKRCVSDGGKLKDWKAKEGEIMIGGGQILTMEAMDFAKVGDVATWAIQQIGKR
jgi:hypothetical protein